MWSESEIIVSFSKSLKRTHIFRTKYSALQTSPALPISTYVVANLVASKSHTSNLMWQSLGLYWVKMTSSIARFKSHASPPESSTWMHSTRSSTASPWIQQFPTNTTVQFEYNSSFSVPVFRGWKGWHLKQNQFNVFL